MVNKIWEIKNKFLERMEKEIGERGIDRVDVAEMDKFADIIHHLAEAEASCWEAEYYKTTVGAMKGNAGYGGGTGSSAGYGNMGSSAGYGNSGSMNQGGGRSGYSMPSGYDTARAGYTESKGGMDVVESLRKQIQESGPDDRARLRNQVMTVIGAM